MDRIARALELARGEQSGAAEGPVEIGFGYTYTRTVSIPRTTLARNRVIWAMDTSDDAVDAYKLLRTRVLRRMRQNNWNTLAITSPGPGAGKSLTAINLAISMAMELGHSALLVDADLRRPSIHGYFGLNPEYGLRDSLRGDVPLEKILFNPGIERFVILPGTQGSGNSSELLSSPKMQGMVREFKERYPARMVLFDLPPVLVGDDVVAFAPHVDAVLMVVEENRTRREEVTRAMELLDGVEVIGTVLNRSSRPSGGADYHYQ